MQEAKLLTSRYPPCDPRPPMLLVTTALMLEARPIVSRLGLKASPETPYPVFRGEDCVLLVTGTGCLKMASATGWAFGTYPGIHAALNVGFAGAAETAANLHEWYLVHSVKDAVTGRLHLPDILIKHPFTERPLLTVSRPVEKDIGWVGLVDMEGSGFLESARRFLAPDRLALLKWVSDPLSGRINAETAGKAYTAALDPVVKFAREWPESCRASVNPHHEAAVAALLGRLRLTSTQAAFLRKWVRGFLARDGSMDKLLSALPAEKPRTKKANTACFNELKDVLKS